MFADWVIEDKLGEGNTAVVYRGRKHHEVAAVKIYKRDLVERFGVGPQIDRINRQLSLKKHPHPSLIRVHAGGLHKPTGDIFVVMNLVEGKPLNEKVKHFPPDRIGPIIAQIADAARHLEKNNIVHRDIKPSNIVVDNDLANAMLLDLGVIRPMADLEADLTDVQSKIGPFLGTVRYSPAEFIERKETHSSDAWRAITFYQLGAVLHDLVTGHRMFDDVRDDRLSEAIKNQEPDLTPRPGVDDRFGALARQCLRKNWWERLEVQWTDFECRRFVRRPVVVLLYTGGTIGATVQPAGEKRALSRVEGKEPPLLANFDRRARRDYEQLSGPEIGLPFDLEWKALPQDQQLLSENASHETWGHLGHAIEKICGDYAQPAIGAPGDSGTYLAGIVLLHGTDTLAYSAAALALALRNLPCPVVLTGSNQPPTDTLRERSLVASEYSDAWKNILRSLQFIRSIGHRFTEVFVCFNDTVHIALNLRKSAIDRSPQPIYEHNLQEPYFYRNRGPLRQYAYRLIDGLYCNNLYPVSVDVDYTTLIQDSTNRHRRQSPLMDSGTAKCLPFADGVRLLLTSPVSFLPSDLRAGSDDPRCRFDILLLEGYNSGTFPTAKDHPFHALLSELQRKAVPIVLVTRNGLVPSAHEYEMAMIDGIETPILRLFGLIAETAAPLLSLVRAEIDDWEAQPGEEPLKLLQRRQQRLRQQIERHFRESNGLLGALVGNVLDRDDQRKMRIEEMQWREEEHSKRVEALFRESHWQLPTRHSKDGVWIRRRIKNPTFDPSLTVLLRQHFLWLLGEVVHSFASSNCGPDGLGFWNELGFAWGRQVSSTFKDQSSSELFDSLPPERRKILLESVKRNEKKITRFLFEQSVAEVYTRFEVVPGSEAEGYRDGRITLTVDAIKHGVGGRDDDLFTALSYREEEAKFFRRLREGVDLAWHDNECASKHQKNFNDLFANALNMKVSPLDWFLIGNYKAMVCRALRDLCFDPWVKLCSKDDRSYVEGLRQSIWTEVVAADTKQFRLRLQYIGRDVSELKPV